MSVVSLLGVKVLNNPAHFSAPYEFEITFECLEQLQKGMNTFTSTNCQAKLADRSRMEAHLRGLCNLVSQLHLLLLRCLSRSDTDQCIQPDLNMTKN